MGQKVKLGTEQRMHLVLRMLSKEEPAAQIARRAGIAEQTLCCLSDYVTGNFQNYFALGCAVIPTLLTAVVQSWEVE